jgi:hypothetical protein
LIRDTEVATCRKTLAADILETIGWPLPDSEIAQHIPGYLEDGLRQLEQFRETASDSPDEIFNTLQSLNTGDGFDEISWDGVGNLASIGISVAEKNQAGATYVGAAVACCADMGARDGRMEEWLSALEKMGSPRAAWCLKTLAKWPMPEAARDRARTGAKKLAAAGVKAAPPPVLAKYSHTILTACDGMGSRSVTFFWKAAGRRLDALNLMLNDLVGIKDVMYLPGNGKEIERRYENNRIQYTSVEPAFAGELVADAMAKHRALRTSPPWQLFPMLPMVECDIRPAARMPNLGAYALGSILCTPNLLKDSFRLMDSPLYGCFTPDTDEAYRFCRKFASTGGTSLPPREFERFVRETAVKDRENLLHRMALNREFESLAWNVSDKKNWLAARTWLAMRDGIVPFGDIPYVRELSRRAVGMMLENIRCGYFSRRQAFEAAQMTDAEYFKSAYTLMDEHGWLDVPPDERITLVDDFMHALEGGNSVPKPQSGRPVKKHGQKPKPRKKKGRRRR